MVERSYLNNQFLVAMPQLADPNFFHTVTYICEHNDEGALGIIINRPTDLTLGDVFAHMAIDGALPESRLIPVFHGGPVQQERGFVIHRPHGDWGSSLAISDRIAVTTSRDILEAIAHGEGPKEALVALGYAGWGSGQLEREISENAWLNGPVEEAILFERAPELRWEIAAARIGIDIALYNGEAGHA